MLFPLSASFIKRPRRGDEGNCLRMTGQTAWMQAERSLKPKVPRREI
jgi:hypothetical protein